MSRLDLAYSLALVLAASLFAMIGLTVRYQRYERALRHGRRPKAVWKPFWMR